MPFYKERRRREARDAAEAEGADFWTDTLDDFARWKIWYAVERAVNNSTVGYFGDFVRNGLLEDLGLATLAGQSHTDMDLRASCLTGDTDLVLSVVEAVALGLWTKRGAAESWHRGAIGVEIEGFTTTVETVLLEHRLKFRLEGLQIVPLESEALHVEVVERALRLVHAPGWELVDKAFRDALGELHGGKPEDAITDAAAALEKALEHLGCSGNTLGKKLDSAMKRGLFGAHDDPLVAAIKKVGDWVSSDRSTSGDAHDPSQTAPANAWLIVHVVGAIIVRLADPEPRGVASD